MSDSQSSTAPLFPWIAEEGISPLTQEIKDPVSGASITLPRLNGLTVNEVLFSQWALSKYEFTQKSIITTSETEVFLSTKASTITELSDFCHHFLCLRLGKADWIENQLAFVGEPIKPEQSLSMVGADGQRRAAPLYLLYLIYHFWIDEQSRWASGKAEPQMLGILGNLLNPQKQTGAISTTSSSENTQDAESSQGEISHDSPPTLSKGRSARPKKIASAA